MHFLFRIIETSCLIIIALQLYFGICHQNGPGIPAGIVIYCLTSASCVCSQW